MVLSSYHVAPSHIGVGISLHELQVILLLEFVTSLLTHCAVKS